MKSFFEMDYFKPTFAGITLLEIFLNFPIHSYF